MFGAPKKTESNNNVREASFGMLQELASLAQLVALLLNPKHENSSVCGRKNA